MTSSHWDAPLVLLVEGEDDLHVVLKLWERISGTATSGTGCFPEFYIDSCGGQSAVLDSIGATIKMDGRRAVGILLDADTDVGAQWDAVAAQLRSAGLEVPEDLPPDGACISGPGHPRVGVWIMPDNRNPGELEDFVRAMVPEADPVWPRAEDYIDRIPSADRQFAEQKTTRAKVYAWMATRKLPGRMGQLAKLGISESDVTEAVSWARAGG